MWTTQKQQKNMGNYRKIIGLDYQAYWEFRKKKIAEC